MTSQINIDRRDLREVLLATVFLIISYTPSPFGFFIYIAFIPLLYLSKRHRPALSFLFGYLVGLLVNAVTLYWLFFYSGTGFTLIVIGNALQFGLLTLILSLAFKNGERKGLFIFPFLWTFLEYTRQFGDLAFTWLNIAHTQTYYLYLIQYVEFTGASGVVFWICLVNISIYLCITRYKKPKHLFQWAAVTLMLFIIPLIYGFNKMTENSSASGLSTAYVQPDIVPETKWRADFQKKNLQLLLTMTDSILIADPDLVVWPETAIPYYLKEEPADLALLRTHVRKHNYHLLTGTLDFKDIISERLKYNAAYFFNAQDSTPAVYRKMQLVPVEEAFPYKRFLPDWMTPAGSEDLSAGNEEKLFCLRTKLYKLSYRDDDWTVTGLEGKETEIKISVVICYESIFPNLVQRFVDNGTQLMIIITNDGWFGYTSQPFQHLQAAVYRALEQRMSVLRCANNGISAFIDPYGRLFLASGLFQQTMAQKVIPLRSEKTFYSIYGDLIGIFCGILIFSFLTFQVLGRNRKISEISD